MSPHRHRVRAPLGALLAFALCGCPHLQEPGAYAFRAEEVLRDDCAQLGPDPESLWDGRLQVAGEIVRMDYALYDMALSGQFKFNVESFVLDGSATDVTAEVAGETCAFELVTLELEAVTESRSAFTGSMRVDYQSRAGGRCACQVSARFRADRTGG